MNAAFRQLITQCWQLVNNANSQLDLDGEGTAAAASGAGVGVVHHKL
jgi:hypothetical protein